MDKWLNGFFGYHALMNKFIEYKYRKPYINSTAKPYNH